MARTERWHAGILEARPGSDHRGSAPWPGTSTLGLRSERDGLLHVPASLAPSRPAPLLVMLHGAGGSGANILPMVVDRAERHGVLVIAPDSLGGTWDMIEQDYGPDVEHIDRALAQAFVAHDIDPNRIAIGGFSDGASFALLLGLIMASCSAISLPSHRALQRPRRYGLAPAFHLPRH